MPDNSNNPTPPNPENSAARWRQRAAAAPQRKSGYKTLSQIPLEPLYTAEHVSQLDYQRDLGMPGEYPYLRESIPAGTGAGSGPCACSPDSAFRRKPISGSSSCWRAVRPV